MGAGPFHTVGKRNPARKKRRRFLGETFGSGALRASPYCLHPQMEAKLFLKVHCKLQEIVCAQMISMTNTGTLGGCSTLQGEEGWIPSLTNLCVCLNTFCALGQN